MECGKHINETLAKAVADDITAAGGQVWVEVLEETDDKGLSRKRWPYTGTNLVILVND